MSAGNRGHFMSKTFHVAAARSSATALTVGTFHSAKRNFIYPRTYQHNCPTAERTTPAEGGILPTPSLRTPPRRHSRRYGRGVAISTLNIVKAVAISYSLFRPRSGGFLLYFFFARPKKKYEKEKTPKREDNLSIGFLPSLETPIIPTDQSLRGFGWTKRRV